MDTRMTEAEVKTKTVLPLLILRAVLIMLSLSLHVSPSRIRPFRTIQNHSEPSRM